MALLDKSQRLEAARLSRWVTHVQTAVDPSFQAEFVAAMALPHAADPFPHLEGLIPAQTAGRSRERRSQRRRATLPSS
jgi:uncharacterized 2Fe-2S/4Fe-4S cluster protein (DUF4445 family)